MSEAVQTAAPPISTNVKETIESILVAFILAFIFRAFVVEAFVIPTGSMATTLLGAHMHFRCPDCGYEFDVNFSSPDASEDMVFPSESYVSNDVYCPNCGYHIAAGPRRGPNGRPVLPFGAQPQPVHYGDRILVLKYAYLLHPPPRWDVVVFKSPSEPGKTHYTQNFIKRLVGRPGETLMVLDGDLYVRDAQDNWQIQRKPQPVQDALWRIVYDNDYYPQGLDRLDARPWSQPWQVAEGKASAQDGQGWDLGHAAADGRMFRFTGQGSATLLYDARANSNTQGTDGYLVYDTQPPMYGFGARPGSEDTVSDLKLAFWYQRTAGSGALKVSLSKRDHTFTAEIGPDAVTLWHTHPDGSTSADAGPIKLADAGLGQSPLWVEFSNVDYRVTLRLNGMDVLHTTDEQYSPNLDELMSEFHGLSAPPHAGPPLIQISAADQTCELSHVSLWRDVYYTNSTRNSSIIWATPDRPVHLHHQGDAREDGSGVYDDDEYFMMGDNSLDSLDARFWSDPIDLPMEGLRMDSGRVPGRFILGKAFFVYWPSGFRPLAGWPPIIPDFGDMRFIH